LKVTILGNDKRVASGSSLSAAEANDFNVQVNLAIDHVIYDIFGQGVLDSLHNHLKDHYGITSDEIPYRLKTLFETLEQIFGFPGARTLTRAVAREIYYRHNIDFRSIDGFTLQDYVEQAKRILQMAEAMRSPENSGGLA